MEYNVDFFIQKFQNTRDDKWCTRSLHKDSSACANGWLGANGHYSRSGEYIITTTPESEALAVVLRPLANDKIRDYHPKYSTIAASINNGQDERYQQSSPKQRILAALHDVKKLQKNNGAHEVKKEKIKYVSVDDSIRKEAHEIIEQKSLIS